MATTITCNKCGNPIEITEAIRAELEEKVLAQAQAKHEQELEQLKLKMTETARKEAIERVRKEYDAKIVATKEESAEREKQNRELQQQVKELLQQMREMKDEKGKLEIEYEKKLFEEQDKIKQTAKQEVHEELNLKMAEKDKQLEDVRKVNAELQRKLEQKSQQLQGEVQELELEKMLAAEFPFDKIGEVPKGIRGADCVQVVRTQTGPVCGTIIWESKRTRSWDAGWIAKLKENQRAVKADLAVLVTATLPAGIQTFGLLQNVVVTDLRSALSVAYILRQQLLKVQSMVVANSNKATKAEVVYNYLVSNDFKQRIEVWVEYFRARREELDKERGYFVKKWEKEEKNIQKVMNNTAGIYGDLQGLMGNALPKVNYLELPDEVE